MGGRPLASEFDEDKLMKLSSEVFSSLDMLKELSKLPKDDFLEDKFKIASAKYFLIVSIEATIDMCNHLISRNRFRIPESYADTFNVMAEKRVISEDLMEKLIEMAKFRNRLVHIYWEVDDEVIYDIIREDIQDIEEFMVKFMDFLK